MTWNPRQNQKKLKKNQENLWTYNNNMTREQRPQTLLLCWHCLFALGVGPHIVVYIKLPSRKLNTCKPSRRQRCVFSGIQPNGASTNLHTDIVVYLRWPSRARQKGKPKIYWKPIVYSPDKIQSLYVGPGNFKKSLGGCSLGWAELSRSQLDMASATARLQNRLFNRILERNLTKLQYFRKSTSTWNSIFLSFFSVFRGPFLFFVNVNVNITWSDEMPFEDFSFAHGWPALSTPGLSR